VAASPATTSTLESSRNPAKTTLNTIKANLIGNTSPENSDFQRAFSGQLGLAEEPPARQGPANYPDDKEHP